MHMQADLSTPDLTISMCPDRCAPRAARYCVGTIERPAAAIRESVVLLTSELVSRAVRLRQTGSHELFELRVWIGDAGARVELEAARELVCGPSQLSDPLDDLLLVDAFADRWAIDADVHSACIWFEIDSEPEGS
jgi:hypothetical protein